MPAPNARELQVLRLVHGGVRLESHGGHAGHLVMPGAPQVLARTIRYMVGAGWLVFDGDCWQLTEAGRELVRVRDDVARFVQEVAS